MCGLFSIFHRRLPIDPDRLRDALASLRHRGPDASAVRIASEMVDGRTVSIGMAHARLSIIDLDERSNQPFVKNGATVLFNGEIFNFENVRADRLSNVEMNTTGDTEVLLEVLRREGAAGIARLSGQWGFVFHGHGSGKLILGRDRFGEKPLFIHRTDDVLIVSSNIAAIAAYLGEAPRFDRDYLRPFMAYSVTPLAGTRTPYVGIEQLPAGHVAEFGFADWTLRSWPVFDENEEPTPADLQDASLEDGLRRAVTTRLVSDRPVGLLLSGGVDSSLILSILKCAGRLDEVTCFIGEAGGSPDAAYARKAAEAVGIRPVVIPIDYDVKAFDGFLKSCAHQERPFRLLGNLLAIPQLYSAIAGTPIKVVLDGTGADEVFGGYWDRYYPFAVRDAVRSGDLGWLGHSAAANLGHFRRLASSLKAAARGRLEQVDPTVRAAFGGCPLPEPLDPLARIDLSFTEAMRRDAMTGRLQDWVWQNDRNSMMHGIEARSPFLDRELYRYIATGYQRKFVGKFNKHELRSAFSRFCPLPTQWRSQKQGFRWSPQRFLSRNADKVAELCASSGVLREIVPATGAILSDLRAGEAKLSSPLVERMLAVAGVEHALGAR